MRPLFLIASIFFTSLLSAQTQPTDSIKCYSLAECVTLGIERNFDILIKREEQGIADNNYSLGNAGYLPSADLSIAAPGNIRNNTYSQQLNSAVNVEWMVFEGFKAQATYARLGELKALGELYTRASIENLSAEIATNYYQIVRQNIRLKNLKKAVELSLERMNIVEARYHLGSASRLEYQQAKVDFNADNTQAIKQQEVIYSYQVRLNELISHTNIGETTRISDHEIKHLTIGTKDELWQKVEDTNSSLLSAERAMTISQADLKIVKSRRYPYLMLNTGYGYYASWTNPNTQPQGNTHGLNLGASLGFSIFDGYNQRRNEKNAKAEIEIRNLEFLSLEQTLRADMETLWMAYTNNKNIIDMEKANVATAQDYLDIAMERYKLGDLSGIELREAQNSLLEALERLSTAEFDTKMSEISLLLLSGEIVEKLAQ